MEEKIIEAVYTVSTGEAKAACELAGDERERFERNRNTTIWFAVIMAMFGISIVRTLVSGNGARDGYALFTYIAFEVICAVLIAVTWLSGRKIVKNAVSELSDGTEIRVFINPNGISAIIGGGEETAIERSRFSVRQNDEIFLLLIDRGKKFVIPKRAFDPEDLKTVSEYLA